MDAITYVKILILVLSLVNFYNSNKDVYLIVYVFFVFNGYATFSLSLAFMHNEVVIYQVINAHTSKQYYYITNYHHQHLSIWRTQFSTRTFSLFFTLI